MFDKTINNVISNNQTFVLINPLFRIRIGNGSFRLDGNYPSEISMPHISDISDRDYKITYRYTVII